MWRRDSQSHFAQIIPLYTTSTPEELPESSQSGLCRMRRIWSPAALPRIVLLATSAVSTGECPWPSSKEVFILSSNRAIIRAYISFNTTATIGPTPKNTTTCTTDLYTSSSEGPVTICKDNGTTCIVYDNTCTDDVQCRLCALCTPGAARYTFCLGEVG